MDWKQVIKRNREALAAVVAGLVVLAGQWTVDPRVKPEDDGLRRNATFLSRRLRLTILRFLRPAESALRRLIVIVAATLRQKAQTRKGEAVPRPLPDFLTFAHGEKRASFRLIDPRKRFGELRPRAGVNMGIPRISVPGLIDAVRPERPDNTFNAAALCRRIESLERALKTLPKQARRLNWLMARRAKAKPGPGRVGPIRPGHPPGYRRRSAHEVDDILRDCHFLALDCGLKPP